ncbi:hypothetical protein ACFL67_00205 [candidate division KSB1 bacterium]
MSYHYFHIPVMGTGFSADTPIRVAPFGIDSVISLVDDILLEKIRKHYCSLYNLPFEKINGNKDDGRARRITAYLEMVKEIVQIRFDEIKGQDFFSDSDKRKYFEMLPPDSLLKKDFYKLLKMKAGELRDSLEKELTSLMKPGKIDVNIMVKLDKMNSNAVESPLSDIYSDAKAALRGFANSSLQAGVVFSAGINQSLFSYMTEFKDFYRNEAGKVKKEIILKVSDFRSALIQGKYLAKKGLEISDFRIESGLNCGGHAFATNGLLLPDILKAFKEKREQLAEDFHNLARKYYDRLGWKYPETAIEEKPLITVQGGIGNNSENQRLRDYFGMDRVGWASPFLLVPEAVCIDNSTMDVLKDAGEEDLYLSDVSPLGVPFNNVRKSGSEVWTQQRAEKGEPGSPCPKGYLKFNSEFSEQPICTASRKYQSIKLDQIQKDPELNGNYPELQQCVIDKSCICDHLGNSALISLGMKEEKKAPQAVCPGPNIAWFDRSYSLKEMVEHIYGVGKSLVPKKRPHMFAKEIELYVDYFENLVKKCSFSVKEVKTLEEFKKNLEEGFNTCMEIAKNRPYPGENLDSIRKYVKKQGNRLEELFSKIKDTAINQG